jgi:hypothetical protein
LSSSVQQDAEESPHDASYRFQDRNLGPDLTEFDEGNEVGDCDHEKGWPTYNDGHDDTNKGLPDYGDAEDMMNPSNIEGEGFVVPRVQGVDSLCLKELEDVMEATLYSVSLPDLDKHSN